MKEVKREMEEAAPTTSLLPVLQKSRFPCSSWLNQSYLPFTWIEENCIQETSVDQARNSSWSYHHPLRWSPLLRNELAINGEPGASASVTAPRRRAWIPVPLFSLWIPCPFQSSGHRLRRAAWVRVPIIAPHPPQAVGPWSRHSPSRGCFLIYKVVLLAAPLSEGWYDCWGHPIRWTAGGGVSAWREYCGGVGCTAVESQKLRPDIMCSLDIWNHKGFSCPNHKFPSTRLLQPNSPLYPGDQVQYLPIPKEQVSVPWTQTPAMDLF